MNNKTLSSLSLYFFSFFLLCTTSSEASLLRRASKVRIAPRANAFTVGSSLVARASARSAPQATARRPLQADHSSNHYSTLARAGAQGVKVDAERASRKPANRAEIIKAYYHGNNVPDDFVRAMWHGELQQFTRILFANKKLANGSINKDFPSVLFYAMHIFGVSHDQVKAQNLNTMIALLINNGANLQLKKSDGRTIFQEALRVNLPRATLKLLISKGAKPDNQDMAAFSASFVDREIAKVTAALSHLNALVPVEAAKPEAPSNSSLPPLVPENPEHFESFADLAGELPAEMHTIARYIKSKELRERFERFGAKIPKGILFHGPPGTGKTAYGRAIAKETGAPFFYLKAADIKNKWVGGTEARITHAFDCVSKHAAVAPSKIGILFLDEFDSYATERDELRESWQRGEVNALLAEMDGVRANSKGHVLVLAATNKKERLDRAAIRPGRFDTHIFVGLPDIAKQKAILKLLLSKKPYELNDSEQQKEEALAQVVELFKMHATNPSPADLKGIVEESARNAALNEKAEHITHELVLKATRKHLGQVAKKDIRKSVL